MRWILALALVCGVLVLGCGCPAHACDRPQVSRGAGFPGGGGGGGGSSSVAINQVFGSRFDPGGGQVSRFDSSSFDIYGKRGRLRSSLSGEAAFQVSNRGKKVRKLVKR